MTWATIGLLVVLLLAALISAAGLSYARFLRRVQRRTSYALRVDDKTALDGYALGLCRERPASSGIVLLTKNVDALAARTAAVRTAERSLDLMYYMWNADLTGMLLMREVLAAADRNVRVRILLDDLGVSMPDRIFRAIDLHPNIELRLFNPTKARENLFRRAIEMAVRFRSVNRRMHNKAFIADGRIAIVGGRNIGDEYFDAGKKSNFRDFDLAMVGAAVSKTEKVFDQYWNSHVSVPVRALLSCRASSLARLRRHMDTIAAAPQAAVHIDRTVSTGALCDIVKMADYVWVERVSVLADPPEKAAGKRKHGQNMLMETLLPVMTGSRRILNITSPYFIPGERGVGALTKLAGAGVAVSVLTNSLAATDVAAVHAGYSRYRPALLAGGVSLYELKASMGQSKLSLRGSGRASLHTKAFSRDGEYGFVGSLNLDPRSISLNTEMGVLFESRALARTLDAVFEDETRPDSSYEVRLRNGHLTWSAADGERQLTSTREPDASLSRRLVSSIIGVLPLESQL